MICALQLRERNESLNHFNYSGHPRWRLKEALILRHISNQKSHDVKVNLINKSIRQTHAMATKTRHDANKFVMT